MKISLVVAQGAHEGKVIPITAPQFLIGRDPQCQLRPASQAVSKQHCAVVVQGDKVLLRDFGSTNGTYVNGERVEGEREVNDQDRIKLGPLEFLLRLDRSVADKPAPTPAPTKPAAAAAAPTVVANPASAPTQAATPKPAAPKPAAPAPAAKAPAPAAPAAKTPAPPAPTAPAPAAPAPEPAPAAASDAGAGEGEGAESDRMAAMLLLGLGDDTSESGGEDGVPDGTTVMELPSVPGETDPAGKPSEGTGEKPAAKPPTEKESTSNAAAAILRKYMNRPRG